MVETYKFRLYPNDEQKVLLEKHFGSVRFVYNWALDYNTKQYAQGKKYIGWMSLVGGGEFIKLKEDNPWLYEIGANTLINTVGHLDKAYQKFFRHQGGFPKHKSKYDSIQSFEVPSGLVLDFKHQKIQIPKFLNKKNNDNRIKCVICRKVKNGKIGTATISRNACGQYFIGFIVHTSEQEQQPIDESLITVENSLGIDFGLKHFLTFSNERKIDSPEYFKQTLNKLAWEQRKLSRKQKGSKNREKQKRKVAKIHNHISNQRINFLHNLSAQIANDSQVQAICIEDLNLMEMSKRWGRKVHDLSYNTFTNMLDYKLKRKGKRLLKIGRFEPSSQICSHCGNRQRISLNERIYKCPECGMEMDRDVNAARNIKMFALREILKNNTDATSGINACGDGGSGKNGQPILSKPPSMNQENLSDLTGNPGYL